MDLCLDKGAWKMKTNTDYIISVKDYMNKTLLPRPKHKSQFLYNDGEFLRIIGVDVGKCQ
jgi:hypothetical protein